MKKEAYNWNNIVIKIESLEHGAKVIDFWKSVGVDTLGFLGFNLVYPYYGVKAGHFNNFNINELKFPELKILTLEEAIAIRDKQNKTFPREMYCWNNNFKNGEILKVVYERTDIEMESSPFQYKFAAVNGNGSVTMYKNVMEIDEYEAMNKNKDILDEIDNTKKQMVELCNKLIELENKLK